MDHITYTQKVFQRLHHANYGPLTTNSNITKQLELFSLNVESVTQFSLFTGEQELVEFLNEEIAAEKNSQKGKTIPTDIDGFKVTLKGADVELTKQTDKEKIQISFNINHTVDTDDDAQNVDEIEEKPMAEMKSTPNFEVDITRGGKTLSFTCSFLKGIPAEEEYSKLQ